MGGRGGMNRERLGVAHVREVRDELERVDEATASLGAALDPEAEDGARAARQVLLGARELLARLESRVVHPGHPLVFLEVARDGERVFRVAHDAQRQRLEALKEEERVE